MDDAQQDARLLVAERVEALLSAMTCEEKVAQLVHDAPGIERLGVDAYNWWNECLHGVARAGMATVFPQAIGMAASFDPDLVRRVATAISDEARAKHHDAARRGNRGMYFGLTYWSPNVNLFRDPRWGRGQETYGEDPYLAGRMAVAFVRALQGDHPQYLKLVATAKHFAVHSGPEKERHRLDARVSPRDLHESYLPAFKACVQEGGVQSVMTAYNRVNGEACCASPTLLGRILREQWGFGGYVVSDCWAIRDLHAHHAVTERPAESAAMALKAGCDLNCGDAYRLLGEALAEGLIDESDVDACLRRLLTARMRLGMFDPEDRVPWSRLSPAVVGCKTHRRLARRMARESIVLLENDGLLPLVRDGAGIAVIGPCALDPAALLGNYHGLSRRLVTPLEGIVAASPPGVSVSYAQGCGLADDRPLRRDEIRWAIEPAAVVVAILGYTGDLEGEEGATGGHPDRLAYGLPGRQQELLEHLASYGKPIVLVLMTGSPVDLSWAKDHVGAILVAWYPGEQGGTAIADVLFGICNPGGRLPVTFVRSYDELPPFADYAMAGRTYRFSAAAPLYRFCQEALDVAVQVSNRGPMDGDEVVQLYVQDLGASVPVPRWHLEGFRRVHLRAGERRRVRFRLAPEQLATFDALGRPFVEPGDLRIWVGGGQPDDPAGSARSAIVTVV
jgi:beta-glucosidase